MNGFDETRPVFRQIMEWIEDNIAIGSWGPDYQLPSVREMSAKFRVNPNTIVRTYEFLMFDGVIYSVKGVGYFVTENAKSSIMERRRKEFYESAMPSFFNKMKVLGLTPEEVLNEYSKFVKDENKQ